MLLLSKHDIGGGATPLAQGGLAVAIGPGDSPALHQRDTLEAGAGLCDQSAVATLVSEAPGEAARSTRAPRVLVATETGLLHQLRRANPAVRWEPVNPGAVCRFMKMTTPAALLRCLREGVTEVTVDPGVARRARRAVQAMLTAGSLPAPAGVTAP